MGTKRTAGRVVATMAAVLGVALPTAAFATSYRVGANATQSIDLRLCNSRVDIAVEGDHDTDLDFTITDDRANVVHRDFDSTDVTYTTISPRNGSGCIVYVLKVQNRGDVSNVFTVELTDRGTALVNRGGAAAPVRQGTQDHNVSVHNHTTEAFRVLRYSNTADDDYGKTNLLEGSPLRPGSSRSFEFNDGTDACHYDMMVETVSGRVYRKRDINVCSVSSVEFGTEISH